MKRNAERELAFTTRTVVYLWCGLPVIYNDYSELSDYIREYNAGWTVDPEDRDAIRAVLKDIFEHPEQIRERSRNAQRLVQERLNWDLTIDPLCRFVCCADLRKSARRSPYKGLRYLWNRAGLHYRRGGLKTVMNEAEPYLRWRLKRFQNR